MLYDLIVYFPVCNNLFYGKLGTPHLSCLIFSSTPKCSHNIALCSSHVFVLHSSIILGPVEFSNQSFPVLSEPISLASKQFSNLSSHLSQELAAVQS